jgi:hypothetical protein
MNHLLRYTLLLSLFVALFGCKKQTKNPCDGVLNESPPKKIGLLLFDKAKDENLILVKALQPADIKVTISETNETHNSWRIVKAQGSPLDGMLEINFFNEKAGDYAYKVEVNGIGTVTIGYTIKQGNTDDPCRAYVYSLTAVKSTSHDFAPMTNNNTTIPNIIKVWLTK